MEVERFAAELPALFEDFPRSEHARGRRFDDVIEGVSNLACENNLALLNLAASLLEPGESYVEVGTYLGASLIAAMSGNAGDFVGIDDFSFPTTEVKGRRLVAAGRTELKANLARFGAEGATILEGNSLTLLRNGILGGRRVGVYYYDAGHSYEEHFDGLRLVEPYLAERALLIVDDSDWEQVGLAVRDYLGGQPRARLLFEIPGGSRGSPQWWEGVVVLAWAR